MQFIAAFMQNETAVVALAIAGMVGGFTGLIILSVVSAMTFLGRLPGGILSLVGASVLVCMFTFATLMTITMEMQYGPAGVVVQNAMYALGGFLCVLGYARLTWWVLRNRRASVDGSDPSAAAAGE
jgi:hypothetical protein